MGTRSLICIFYKGRFVVAQYTQWDGYPDGQGTKILGFLLVAGNIERLKAGLEHLYIPTKEELGQVDKELARLQDWQRKLNTGGPPSLQMTKSPINEYWPSLSRDTGGSIFEVIAQATAAKPVPIQLELEFVGDGLFCEWAYVVDLDLGVFEVYKGGNREDKAQSKRFNNIGGESDTVPALIESFSLTGLPATEAEFLSAVNRKLKSTEEE